MLKPNLLLLRGTHAGDFRRDLSRAEFLDACGNRGAIPGQRYGFFGQASSGGDGLR